ncbi:protein PBDC1-like isoform X2 [Watersipora subatra]|uniref:protein PBDC1-like isoform X2 n=1 Tax=Watersipora subatra TaxID=2589382 RepID=UPI00355AEBBA
MRESWQNSTELASTASVLSRPANEFGNSTDIEMQWAMKSSAHAETYFNILTSTEPKFLKLTKCDDEIYNRFRQEFPDEKIDQLNIDNIKSDKGKEKWRPFCEAFKDQVDEYNFLSLIRTDCTGDYTEENTFVGPKIQFLAIEIARNREGLNSGLRAKFGKKT